PARPCACPGAPLGGWAAGALLAGAPPRRRACPADRTADSVNLLARRGGSAVKYRVIQWATGGVGRAAIEGILSHPELELVGCWVHSADKAGKDVGELAGIGPIGVRATNDVAQLLPLDADCVMYSPILAKREEVIRILESGKNVVTPLNWFYPNRAKVADLEAACRKGGVTLHGTGIHPGGITERFPLMVSALSRNITHVRAEEFSDCRSYG